MKDFYEFMVDEEATMKEIVTKICLEIGISLDVEDEKDLSYDILRNYLAEKEDMKLVVANCGLDDIEFRVFIFSESTKSKKKVKDRYIKIMSEQFEGIGRLYTWRLEETLNHIYD